MILKKKRRKKKLLLLAAAGLVWGRGGEERGRALMSPALPEAWWLGVATGLGWGVGFARLATELLPHGFQNQVTGDSVSGGLERS